MGRVVTRSQRLKLLNKCSNDDSNSNSNSSERCEVISEVLLSQDLMLHILTLLPLKCLVNSARYVCKPWATIIQTSQFAQACLRHSKPGLLVQCFYHTYFLGIKDYVNGQFEFEKSDMGTKSGRVIDTCNGILVLVEYDKSLDEAVAFLFNPITKYCFRIPPLHLSQKPKKPCSLFYSQMTLVCVPHTAKFKIFFIDVLEVSGAFYYVFYVLTIGIDNSWREIDRKKASLSWLRFWEKTLYDGGNHLYWMTQEHGITLVDVDKEIVVGKFSPPPVPIYCAVEDVRRFFPRFLWMGNQLSCIVTKRRVIHDTFQIYLLDFDSGKWFHYHDVGHLDYVAAFGHELTIFEISFDCWIHDQIIFEIFFKEKRPQAIVRNMNFSYSVQTRKLTKIEGIKNENIFVGDHVMLHTNSLISLPSTPT